MWLYIRSHGVWVNLNNLVAIEVFDNRVEFNDDQVIVSADNPDFKQIKSKVEKYLKAKEVK